MVEMEVAHRHHVDASPGRTRPPRAPARSTGPRSRASSRVLSSSRSPIPVSTRTRPAGSRSAGSSGPGAAGACRRSRRRRARPTGPTARARTASRRRSGTCPPGSGRPARRRRGRLDQSTASFMAIAARPPGRLAGRATGIEIAVEGGRGRLRLALVLRPELGRAVRPVDRARHLEEADLADPHPEVERDRQVRDVRELERQVALPAGIDIARRRVDEQAEPPRDDFPSSLATRSSGSSTHSRVWPSTNSPGWRMNGSSSSTVRSSVRSGCGARTSMNGVAVVAEDPEALGRGGGRPTTAAGRAGRTGRC